MNNQKQLIRFATVGSVDDGKSTLIGRLLLDSKSIFEDQLKSVEKVSANNEIDLALFTDGLKEERDRGITIDVAYRYFSTPKNKFIIADSPGHIEFTRNMFTAVSTSNAIIVLIDARNGIVEQTIRHTFIASLLNVDHAIVCINKMDLVNYSEKTFTRVVNEFEYLLSETELQNITYIPTSAIKGDNIVECSKNMDWYNGAPLLNVLETLNTFNNVKNDNARFPVQTIIESNDYKGYAGRIVSGVFEVDDSVTVLPSGINAKIKSINAFEKKLTKAYAPMSVLITLDNDMNISRGDMIVQEKKQSKLCKNIEVVLCWLSDDPLSENTRLLIQHTTARQEVAIEEVVYKINIDSLKKDYQDKSMRVNDICRVNLKTAKPLILDPYKENKSTGSFILIDERTKNTVGAGVILKR
ncbi:GTP-binding protein [Flavobacteriaceae sp. LMIT009]